MINIINDFSFKFNSSVKLNFGDGDLTTDSNGLLTEEFTETFINIQQLYTQLNE